MNTSLTLSAPEAAVIQPSSATVEMNNVGFLTFSSISTKTIRLAPGGRQHVYVYGVSNCSKFQN
jgi:hypothetical protein